ncbi:MAG: DNA polymerase III subunit delta' [Thermus sp.]|uniref:DNA polymerase III subunit delta' n=1 Tax=Thermus sp. TaxID=275 RepID=UPI0030B2E285
MASGAAQGGTIIGHEAILALLPRIEASTLLFTGPEGVGRRTVARWYALGLNLGFPPPPLSEHPDLLEIAPKGKALRGKAELSLEEVEPLFAWLSTHPRARAKVAILDGAHLLTPPAANALLKLLEEPPAYARLILIAPSRDTLLPTLASRSVEVAFSPVPEEKLRALTEDPELLAYAKGAPGRLLGALADLEAFRARMETARALLQAGPLERLRLLKELLEEAEGFQALHTLLKDPAHLSALFRAQEALERYVSPDLVLARLALDLGV